MHVPIEQLYEFVMGRGDLTGAELSHLIRCDFCVDWLDGCVTEKLALLTNHFDRALDDQKSR